MPNKPKGAAARREVPKLWLLVMQRARRVNGSAALSRMLPVSLTVAGDKAHGGPQALSSSREVEARRTNPRSRRLDSNRSCLDMLVAAYRRG